MFRALHRIITLVLVCTIGSASLLRAQAPVAAANIKAEELYGKWQSDVDGSIIEIGQVNRGDNSKIKLVGRHDDWAGSYDGKELQVIRKPKAEEMDEKAPLWARQEVAKQGNLWWSLNLTPEEEGCDGLKLTGKWFRGELTWKETDDGTGNVTREASSSGKYVNPIDVKYTKVGGDEGTLELSGRPTIVALPHRDRKFSDYFLAESSLTSIYKTQPFDVFVRMPHSMADDTGGSLAVTFRTSKTGRSAAIQLSRTDYSRNGPVIYRRDTPVVIADPGSGADDIRLKASNEDRITASYPGADEISFDLYDSQWQFGIAANEEGFRRMLALYNAIILDSQDAKVREAAHQKILLINNARHLINDYKPEPLPALYIDLKGTLKHWDKITDITRVFIGRRYMDLLETDTTVIPNPAPGEIRGPIPATVRDEFYKILGITLTGQQELNALIKGFEDGEQTFKDAFWKEFTPQFAMGLYQVVALTHNINSVSQSVEQLLILFIGVDIFGEPVDKTTKILNAVNLGSQLLLKAVSFSRFLEGFTSRSSRPLVRVVANEAGDMVNARKPSEVLLEGLPGAKEVKYPRVPVSTPLQAREDTCMLMVLIGHIKDSGLPTVSEDLMAAFGESVGAYKYLSGTNRFGAAKMLEELGLKATIVGSNLRAIRAAIKRGLQVNVSVVIEGGTRHAIRIRDVLTNPMKETFVHFEDPWSGKLWSMEEKAFCKIVAKDPLGRFENVMFVDPSGLKGPISLSGH